MSGITNLVETEVIQDGKITLSIEPMPGTVELLPCPFCGSEAYIKGIR